MYSGKSVKRTVSGVMVAVGLALLWPGFGVAAQGGEVQIMVCPQPSESRFSVLAPVSDSIVDVPKVSITGAVEYISQIDFFVDGTYNHTQALGYSAANFTSSLTLSPGTHTLKFIASDSCSQTIHEQSVVMTYEPKAVSSIGETVATRVEETERAAEPTEPLPEHNFFQQYIEPPLRGIAEVLDLTEPSPGVEPVSPLPSAGRAMLFIAGTSAVVSGVYLSTLATLPAHMTFILPHRRLFLGGLVTAGAVLIGVVFTL